MFQLLDTPTISFSRIRLVRVRNPNITETSGQRGWEVNLWPHCEVPALTTAPSCCPQWLFIVNYIVNKGLGMVSYQSSEWTEGSLRGEAQTEPYARSLFVQKKLEDKLSCWEEEGGRKRRSGRRKGGRVGTAAGQQMILSQETGISQVRAKGHNPQSSGEHFTKRSIFKAQVPEGQSAQGGRRNRSDLCSQSGTSPGVYSKPVCFLICLSAEHPNGPTLETDEWSCFICLFCRT